MFSELQKSSCSITGLWSCVYGANYQWTATTWEIVNVGTAVCCFRRAIGFRQFRLYKNVIWWNGGRVPSSSVGCVVAYCPADHTTPSLRCRSRPRTCPGAERQDRRSFQPVSRSESWRTIKQENAPGPPCRQQQRQSPFEVTPGRAIQTGRPVVSSWPTPFGGCRCWDELSRCRSRSSRRCTHSLGDIFLYIPLRSAVYLLFSYSTPPIHRTPSY